LSGAKPPVPTKKKAPAKRRSGEPSSPEVKLSYRVAGRDTLATIDAELTRAVPTVIEPPLLEISEAPAGRDTLAAIENELGAAPRARQNTVPYEDKIKNAPGARSPSRAPVPPRRKTPPPAARAVSEPDDAPDEVTIRTKLPAVAPPTPAAAPSAGPAALEIFELLTFIVRGSNVGDLSTDALRRRFVQEHLLRRVPGGSIDAVERIEVTPWTAKDTMVLRVWCRA
jgi:hypothetical protein